MTNDHQAGFVGSHNPKLSALRINDLDQFKRIVMRAMVMSNGDISRTAALLKIGRNTMYRWMKDHPELKAKHRDVLDSLGK